MHPDYRPIERRYFTVTAPAPWNKNGQAKVTVRTGGPYAVYLCVGNDRVPMQQAQGWALLAALANALQASYGPMPRLGQHSHGPVPAQAGPTHLRNLHTPKP